MDIPQNSTDELYCPRGESSCQFLTEIIQLRREVDLLAEQVRTDALTGLFNFRFFSETITLEMERARRGVQPLSMILLDIDHFKKFNDQWGHEAGNHALQHVAQLIKIAVRKLDYPCRFGGEEFVILLPNTDLRQAIHVATRLREMIATTSFVIEAKGSVPAEKIELTVNASLGVDQFSPNQSETSESFIQRVDSLLYQAKHQGRNRVVHAPLPSVQLPESVTLEEKDALFNLLNDDTENDLSE